MECWLGVGVRGRHESEFDLNAALLIECWFVWERGRERTANG